jgi:glycerophosphoryl diester phosphodiesterase
MPDWKSIIEKWPSPEAMAQDVKVSPITVRAWRLRGIPPLRWLAVVHAAKRRGYHGVTLDRLAALAKRQRRRA